MRDPVHVARDNHLALSWSVTETSSVATAVVVSAMFARGSGAVRLLHKIRSVGSAQSMNSGERVTVLLSSWAQNCREHAKTAR